MTSRVAPSGGQFKIAYGEQRATIVEVGGGIREYSAGDREVLEPYPVDAICDGAHGMPLIPWPNRLADGRYSFNGEDHQVALSEPERHNAIHGFLRWRSWRALSHKPSALTMGVRLHPMPGYPYSLDVSVTYELDDEGLTVTTAARNVGAHRCPYACGQHPYLSPGGASIDDCSLALPATTRILTDDERKLPIGSEAVAGTVFDFRTPRRVGNLSIDDAFTELVPDDHGRVIVTLGRPDEHSIELWVDERYRVLEIYTGDSLAPGRRRRGLGLEPMTCPPNGLASGEGIIVLEPGEEHTAKWGVRLR